MSDAPKPDTLDVICAAADTALGLAPGTMRQDVDRRDQESAQAAAATQVARAILERAEVVGASGNPLARFLLAAARHTMRSHEAAVAIGADMRLGSQ